MVQNVSLAPVTAPPQYKNVVTKQELKLDNAVFRNAEKLVKKDEVRNSDYGLVAAQTCLARDFVNADVDEARFIAEKMKFIHILMADNIAADASRYNEKMKIKAEQIPAKVELSKVRGDNLSAALKSGSEGISAVIKSGGEFIKTGTDALKSITPVAGADKVGKTKPE